jgi:hypothetical protein
MKPPTHVLTRKLATDVCQGCFLDFYPFKPAEKQQLRFATPSNDAKTFILYQVAVV